ncbi:glycosyltransferase [Latilactobacillus curvatus]|uniref:glycosyltransferase n=1 Tax=Latilactobacillus curvatus TaxID=28038 RepID=UPI001C0071E3|nr:glycosyltransferase [Latilactobacillus curvatus]MCM0725799.1 glycosyltransferase [Latilactobacillus curvatus]QWF35991.1 glycosyltransferase [Latilactobacillus curvatus]
METISFILPIYGTENSILEAGLERLKLAKTTSFEFLLISDGARDDLVAICRRFSEEDKRFKLIEQANQGVSVARNTGIKAAKGTWLLFVDPDDLLAEKFEEILLEKASTNADVIFFGFDRVYQDGKVENSFPKDKLFPATPVSMDDLIRATLSDGAYYNGIYGYFLGTPWAKMFRKSFLEANQLFYPAGIIKREDALFSIEVFLKNPRINIVDSILYHYRIDHDNSISNSYRQGVKESFITVSNNLNDDLVDWLQQSDNALFLDSYMLRLSIELLFADFCNLSNSKSYQERKNEFKTYLETPVVSKQIKNARLVNMPMKQKLLGLLIKQRNFYLLNYLLFKRKRG